MLPQPHRAAPAGLAGTGVGETGCGL